MSKRYIAILLSIVLLFNMLPGTALNAFAQEVTEEQVIDENGGNEQEELSNSEEESEEQTEEVSEEPIEEVSEADEDPTSEPDAGGESDEETEGEAEEDPTGEPDVDGESDEEILEETESDAALELVDTTIYGMLFAAETLADFWQIMMAEENKEAVLELTAEEILGLKEKVNELYAGVLEPTEDDLEYRDMLLETFDILPNSEMNIEEEEQEDEETVESLAITEDGVTYAKTAEFGKGDWQGGTDIVENTKWEFIDTEVPGKPAVVTLKKPITIKNGATLKIVGYGSFARYSTNILPLFIVEAGGTLILKGASKDKMVYIDGKDVIAIEPLIASAGTLDFTNASIQNGKNRWINNNNKPEDYDLSIINNPTTQGNGGGIYSIYANEKSELIMKNCVVTKNTATVNGGGVVCTTKMTITDSIISCNRAMSSETGGVNKGRGGGFFLDGSNASGTLENVIVEENAAMYYGGGGQVSNKASLTMSGDTTVFRKNEAILHGAGALHVTGSATFVMNGGRMEDNSAQTVGGAIHSSYGCTLSLNKGKILNNTANGRGGGVHINTGGSVVLNEHIEISGNKAYDQPTGSYAIVDDRGDNWSYVRYEGTHENNGYGGGILIDSGTCTVNGAKINNNYAEVGGGGVALVMINIATGGLPYLLVVNFTMTSGEVSGNKTDGNGAGVYLMSNKVKENIIAQHGAVDSAGYNAAVNSLHDKKLLDEIPKAMISGGTVSGNTAHGNGGGLYLGEKTEFEITESESNDKIIIPKLSENKAKDGAGVYVASGTVKINGGELSSNEASGDGGAVYVNGEFFMGNGELTFNKATANGGAVCVSGGNFTMGNGKLDSNEATSNGGAVYADGGEISITNGAMSQNTASNGGAIYANGGNIGIAHGEFNSNTAEKNGGAIYMAGAVGKEPTLTMISGKIIKNKAIGEPGKKDIGNGGGIFADGGSVILGVETCCGPFADSTRANITNHNQEVYHHPEIKGNSAENSTGGGISIRKSGKITIYCLDAIDNDALNKGVGVNVFIDGESGELHLHPGAKIGENRDPDVTSTNGTVFYYDENGNVARDSIQIQYYQTNKSNEQVSDTTVTENVRLNLPEADYLDLKAPNQGDRFFGWTAKYEDGESSSVRKKSDYIEIGTPFVVTDEEKKSEPKEIFDEAEDGVMKLYALWAPEVNNITYVNSLTGKEFESTEIGKNPVTYRMHDDAKGKIYEIEEIAQKGYAFVGWYIYQNEGINANWTDDKITYDPVYVDTMPDGLEKAEKYKYLNWQEMQDQFIEADKNGKIELTVPMKTFGDITLVAYYQELREFEIIRTNPCENDQVYVYEVKNEADPTFVIYATVTEGNKAVINDLPPGKYTVTQINGWSWRNTGKKDDIDDNDMKTGIDHTYIDPYILAPDDATSVSFSDAVTNGQWLNGNSEICPNTYN